MALVRNNTDKDLRGPDGYILSPGEVREVPDRWLRRRDSRIRRGQLVVVDECELADEEE